MSEVQTETKEERRARKLQRKERKEANGTVDSNIAASEKKKKKKKEKAQENDDVMTALDKALGDDNTSEEKSIKSKKRSKEGLTRAEVEGVLAELKAEENDEHESVKDRKKKNKTENTTTSDAEETPQRKGRKRSEKRKREQDADGNELEIDLSLPEPPSKKALRRSKKGKAPLPSVNDDSAPKRKEKPDSYLDDGEEVTPRVEGTRKSTRIAEQPKNWSEFGVWIGNLNWSMTTEGLKNFLTTNSSVTAEDILRLHMPKPKENDTVRARMRIKPENSGYAYVDVPNAECRDALIALSETDITGRKILIKDSKSFEGRPEKKAMEPVTKPPNNRVFIGNLSFDVTKEEVETLYSPCGGVEQVFLATFEDSGKCKGFGWVTFDSIEAASQAVQGFTIKAPEADSEEEQEEGETKRKPKKGRKWFVNQLNGRKIKCEFAEDKSVRYKKRFGKDKPKEGEDEALEVYE